MINLKEKLTDIADKFRSVLETTDNIYPDDFTSKIDEVYDKGYNVGLANSESQGGDLKWDDITNSGNRTAYQYAFYYWGCEYIRPYKKITPTGNNIMRMFARNTKLKKVESDYFDLSQANLSDTSTNNGNAQVFEACSGLETVEDIGMPAAYYYRTFYECPKLKTIETLRFKETTLISDAFKGCEALENINNVEGTIGVDINLQWSPLSNDSMKRIILALADYSGTAKASTCTVSFSDTCWANLDTEGNTSPNNNSWSLYVGDKGWLK